MSRHLLAGTLAAAALAGLAAVPAQADRHYRNSLDEKGHPFGETWSDTGRFDALTAAGMDDVRFVAGDRWRIRASGDARALAQLRYMVEKNALVVGRISGQRERYGKVRIEITAPVLRRVTAAGSGAVDVDRLTGERVEATIAGSGSGVVRQLAAKRFDATVAGSGQLTVSGRSDAAGITVAGSGGLNGTGLALGRASVTVAGSGSARLRVSGPVSASMVGSGGAFVTGTTDCRQTRIGSGRLVCSA